jgi:hypothetical protein
MRCRAQVEEFAMDRRTGILVPKGLRDRKMVSILHIW